MELFVRSAIVDICRHAFATCGPCTLTVHCKIDVHSDVSCLFSTNFKDVIKIDLSLVDGTAAEFIADKTGNPNLLLSSIHQVTEGNGLVARPPSANKCSVTKSTFSGIPLITTDSCTKVPLCHNITDASKIDKELSSAASKAAVAAEKSVHPENMLKDNKQSIADEDLQQLPAIKKSNSDRKRLGTSAVLSQHVSKALIKRHKSDSAAHSISVKKCNRMKSSIESLVQNNNLDNHHRSSRGDTIKNSKRDHQTDSSSDTSIHKASDVSNLEISHVSSNSSENLDIMAVDNSSETAAEALCNQQITGKFLSKLSAVANEGVSKLYNGTLSVHMPVPCKLSPAILPDPGSCTEQMTIDRMPSSRSMKGSTSSDKMLNSSAGSDTDLFWSSDFLQCGSFIADDRVKKFACSDCECSFSMLTNLRRHIKKVHSSSSNTKLAASTKSILSMPVVSKLRPTPPQPIKVEGKSDSKISPIRPVPILKTVATTGTVVGPPKKLSRYRHVCSICNTAFTFRTNMTRHAKKMHGCVPLELLSAGVGSVDTA